MNKEIIERDGQLIEITTSISERVLSLEDTQFKIDKLEIEKASYIVRKEAIQAAMNNKVDPPGGVE